MLTRVAGEQEQFVFGPLRWWNLFDSCLLCFMITTLFIKASALDLIRIVRIVRMVRILEIFPDLRAMLYSVVACMSCLGWGFVLLFCLLWAYSIFLMEVSIFYMPTMDDKGVSEV